AGMPVYTTIGGSPGSSDDRKNSNISQYDNVNHNHLRNGADK
ncbi:hypothetical protein GWI33_011576, partial [Rhynchophorus ferrugineus]